MDSKNFKNKKDLLVQIVWLVVIVALFFFSIKLLRSGDLQQVVASLGIWAPLLVVILKMTTLVVAPLGGTPIYVLSGAIFGPFVGFIITLIGDVLGSSVCFFLSRKYGARILKIFAGESNVEKILRTVNLISGAKTFAKARLGFVSMPELLAYAAGLSKIKFSTFAFINSVFFVPMVFLYVFFGAVVAELSLKYFFLFPGIVLLFSIMGFLLLYREYEKVEGM